MNELKINHLAAVVCIVLLHILGFLWYGFLFAEQWMAMVGTDQATMENADPEIGIWITNFVAIVVPVYVLAWLFTKLNVTSGLRGAGLGLLISFSFHHLTEMNGNGFAGSPYGLAWITGGYSMVSMAISGFILGAWIKKPTA